LPSDRPAAGARVGPAGRVERTLSRTLAEHARRVAVAHGTGSFTVLLAAFHALLARHSGQTDLVVGMPVAGRDRADTQEVIGHLAGTLVVRTRVEDDPTVAALVTRTRDALVGALEHRAVPYERLARELGAGAGDSALFDVMFVQQDGTRRTTRLGAAVLEAVPLAPATAAFPLSLSVTETERGIRVAAEYRADLFEAATVARMLEQYEALLGAIVGSADGRLSTLPLLSESERAVLLDEWGHTAVDVPRGIALHELVLQRAARWPDAPAVTMEGTTWSYATLMAHADRVARRLVARGIMPGQHVAVAVERSHALVAVLQGVLMAGAAIVPIDANDPPERVAFVLDDAQVALLLHDEVTRSLLGAAAGVPSLDAQDAINDGAPDATLPAVDEESVAVVLFTSGSTGRPKGVRLSHRGFVTHASSLESLIPFRAGDVLLHRTPLSFDAATWEIFGTLAAGGRLVLARPGGHSDADYAAELLEREGVTVLQGVPSVVRMMLDSPAMARSRTLQHVIVGGEAVTPDFVAALRATVPWARVHNGYGPTEATVDATWWTVPDGESPSVVPIGRPVGNNRAYVLSPAMQLQPIGVPGELYIGGRGVALGYLGRPDLTAERFVLDPFAADGSRMYRTGDRARWRADGELEFMGRLDDQVKLRGVRLEVAEVEAVLRGVPGVSAVAVALRGQTNAQRLVAYYVAAEAGADLAAELRDAASRALPPAVVPTAYVRLESIPLTASGKTNRRALPEPPEAEDVERFVEPRDDVERAVASVWSEVLGRGRVGVETSFFDLGGHSLLATRIIGRLARTFRVTLPLRRFFAEPTIAGVSRALCELEPKAGQSLRIAELYLKVQRMTPEEREKLRREQPRTNDSSGSR
ncbi:MAG TPA: amino acid adenylation domain-containing protein, partial [Gemmatimonadaceae bacterium]